jgi:hypothetical protein
MFPDITANLAVGISPSRRNSLREGIVIFVLEPAVCFLKGFCEGIYGIAVTVY